MTIAKLICISLVLFVVLAVAGAGRSLAAEHPASGHEVTEYFSKLSNSDHKWPPTEWSLGDITFHTSPRPAAETLTQEEMVHLLAQLEASNQPNTCPHGRPTMVHLSAAHLQREFGRR
ncbi:hypothetical protein IIA79_03510 [bacterium]|nr:hypothetical protein [bacterium]